jgi:hypothetical protein
VAMATACTTGSVYPCTATVTIADDNSTMPLRFASYGSIVVLGLWPREDQALLTVSFVDTFAGSSLFQVKHVSAFPVTRALDGNLRIVYANVDIDIATGPADPSSLTDEEKNVQLGLISITASDEPSVNMDMDVWVIEADDKGTPDVSDDTYSISGGGQYIEAGSGAASVLQLGMANVVMGPGCELNPVSGLAVMNETVSATSDVVAATALISFPSACDGNARVTGATGNYLRANGEMIPLKLDAP